MSAAPDDDSALLAGELRAVLGQLVRRLRAKHRFPVAQGNVLRHLDRGGPVGVSDLAGAEGVRPQSMAQTVGDLESAGMVTRRKDPSDGRRQLVELTPTGRTTLHEDRQAREGWMARVIADELDGDERAKLREALELVRRITEDEAH